MEPKPMKGEGLYHMRVRLLSVLETDSSQLISDLYLWSTVGHAMRDIMRNLGRALREEP